MVTAFRYGYSDSFIKASIRQIERLTGLSFLYNLQNLTEEPSVRAPLLYFAQTLSYSPYSGGELLFPTDNFLDVVEFVEGFEGG